jgi:hypothetical protein
VFDTMTEYLKQKKMEMHILAVFKKIIDAHDWDIQIKLMEVFKKRIYSYLPEEIRDIPAKQLASQWETVIRYYVESLDKVSDMMKRF